MVRKRKPCDGRSHLGEGGDAELRLHLGVERHPRRFHPSADDAARWGFVLSGFAEPMGLDKPQT
jgi:hypothetical protein